MHYWDVVLQAYSKKRNVAQIYESKTMIHKDKAKQSHYNNLL